MVIDQMWLDEMAVGLVMKLKIMVDLEQWLNMVVDLDI